MRDLVPDGVGFDLGLKFCYQKKKKRFPLSVCLERNFEGPGIFWGKKIQYVHIENLCNRF